MITRLHHLSLAVSDIDQNDVKKVANKVNVEVCNAFNASVVKLYWKERAERGIILNPVDWINRTDYTSPRPFQVDDRPGGILSWVVHNRRTLWLENIQSTRQTGEPLKARSVRQEESVDIPREYDDFVDGPPLQAMVSVPLFNEHGEISGIYSVELSQPGVITRELVEIVQMLGTSLARLLWECEVTSTNLENTRKAVNQFLESLEDIPFSVTQNHRSCFIARPFEREFERVEQIVFACLREKQIRARSYRPGRDIIIKDIMTQISDSNFGIADITGANANVMAELGMMMILPRAVMLLRRKGDATPAPFNIAMYPIYDYELVDNELLIHVPTQRVAQPFETALSGFIATLPAEAGFQSARAWHGEDGDSGPE